MFLKYMYKSGKLLESHAERQGDGSIFYLDQDSNSQLNQDMKR